VTAWSLVMLVAFDKSSPGQTAGDPALDEQLRRPRHRRRWAVAVVTLALACAGLAWTRARAGGARVRYETSPVREGPIVGRVTANGTLAALVTVQVGSQVSGRIQEIFVDFNSKVVKGQVLARLDPELFRAAVEQARANLAAATGNLARVQAHATNAQTYLGRAQTLVRRDLIAGAELDRAQAEASAGEGEVSAGRGSVAQARAGLHQAEVNLAYATIKSPVDGVVISRNVDVGQTVAASLQAPTLFTIAEDLTEMQVHTNVPEADVGKLRPGQRATFTVDAFPDERFAGEIQAIRNASQVTQNVVTYDAVVTVKNPALRLRPGMTATVTFVYAERPHVLLVPVAALRFQPQRGKGEPSSATDLVQRDESPTASGSTGSSGNDHRALYVLGPQGPKRAKVRLGLSDGTFMEILQGPLKAGDLVIVDERQEGGAHDDKGGRSPRLF
jgi:HlyD family secretion protein